jgi:plastocyanin
MAESRSDEAGVLSQSTKGRGRQSLGRAWPAVVVVLAVAAACGGGDSPSAPTASGGGSGGVPDLSTITISNGGVASPQSVTIRQGGRVTFVNNDSRPHDMSSDPHPTHEDCPPMGQVGFLTPGQSRTSGNFTTAGTCGFHDHNQPTVQGLQGRITILP